MAVFCGAIPLVTVVVNTMGDAATTLTGTDWADGTTGDCPIAMPWEPPRTTRRLTEAVEDDSGDAAGCVLNEVVVLTLTTAAGCRVDATGVTGDGQ